MSKGSRTPPADGPPGTVWIGGPVPWFSISLSISADDLDPDHVSRTLGVQPDVVRRRGASFPPGAKKPRPSKFGMWSTRLKREESPELELDAALEFILDRVAVSPAVWHEVIEGAEARIFVGLSLDTRNRGFRLSSGLLRRIADRNINLDFDIYVDPEPEVLPKKLKPKIKLVSSSRE